MMQTKRDTLNDPGATLTMARVFGVTVEQLALGDESLPELAKERRKSNV